MRSQAGRGRPRTSILVALCFAASTWAPGTGPAPAVAATVEGSRGAVAAEHRLASEAGLEILRLGGNAVDAAAAAALATGVVNPSSSGIGGGGFLLLWDAKRSRAEVIDFRETAPASASRDMYLGADGALDAEASKTGPRAVAVPGELRGLALALERHGRLSFAEVAAPAIRLAREGFRIEAHLAAQVASGRERLAADPSLSKTFLHEDGSPRLEGETLARPELAATLERIARVGVDDFHEGELAAAIVRATTTASGEAAMSAADLAGYRPVVREPLSARYRGRVVHSMPPPSSGGGVLGEALGVLGAYDLAAIGRDGATWPHLLGETLKSVFADRAVFYGDPAFADVPLARLLGPSHTRFLRSRLRASRAIPSAELAPRTDPGSDAGTTHISVIDSEGGAAALTTSVNTSFGAGLAVPGHDIVLNNTMDDFSAQPGKPNAFGLVGSQANAIAPGKRPLSSMTPTIVVEDGRVCLVAGGSGGPLILTSTLQVLLGVVDFGLGSEEAVGAPRIHHQWLPDALMVEDGVPDATRASLRRLGHRVMPMPGKASVQTVERRGGRLVATSDPRKGGVPAAW